MTAQEVVDSLYASLLGRRPAGGEEATKVDYLRSGGSVEQVVEWILGSAECQLWFWRNPVFDAITAPDPLGPDVARLYLWHLPKTGGTSLREMLRPHFDETEFCGGLSLSELYRMSQYRLRSFRVIAGHFGPTLPRLLADVPLVTATIVREPVAMVVSHYLHWRERGAPMDPLTALARRMTFDEWCRSEATHGLWSNPQATSLCLERRPPDRREAHVAPEGGTVPAPGADLSELAAATLEGVDLVGTTADVLALYRACLQRMGIPRPLFDEPLRENVGARADFPVSSATRDWLLEHNTVDSDLFGRAEARSTELESPAADPAAHPAGGGPAGGGRPGGGRSGRPDPPRADPPRAGPAPTTRRPGPAPTTRRPGRAWLDAPLVPNRSVGRLLAVALLVSSAVAICDALLPGVILIGLLVIGPCCALFSGRWRTTAVAGVWSVLLGVVVAIPDGIWATATQGLYLAALTVVSIAATLASALLERNQVLRA